MAHLLINVFFVEYNVLDRAQERFFCVQLSTSAEAQHEFF